MYQDGEFMMTALAKLRSQWKWNRYVALLFLYAFGFVAAFPFIFTIQEYTLSESLIIELVQEFLLGLVILTAGFVLSLSTRLGTPYIEKWLSKKSGRAFLDIVVPLSIIVVIVSSFMLLILRVVMFVSVIAVGGDASALMSYSTNFLMNYPATWKWLLVSFHAGVIEEIIFRFGFMNLLVWAGRGIFKNQRKSLQTTIIWIANLAAALVFGFLHLVGVLPVPDVVFAQISVVIQNTLVGLVFGWFYWKFGLEGAMLTHFLLDVFFYVVMIPVLASANFAFILAWLVMTAVILIVSVNKYTANKARLI